MLSTGESWGAQERCFRSASAKRSRTARPCNRKERQLEAEDLLIPYWIGEGGGGGAGKERGCGPLSKCPGEEVSQEGSQQVQGSSQEETGRRQGQIERKQIAKSRDKSVSKTVK